MVLQSYLNRQTFTAFPAVPTLAARVGRSETAVRNALKTLVRRQHLRIEPQWKGREQLSNHYRPLIHGGMMSQVTTSYDVVKTAPPPPVAPPSSGNDTLTSDLNLRIEPPNRTSIATRVVFNDAVEKQPLALQENGRRKEALQGSRNTGAPIAKPYTSRNAKDYFWMTEYACGVPDWMDVL